MSFAIHQHRLQHEPARFVSLTPTPYCTWAVWLGGPEARLWSMLGLCRFLALDLNKKTLSFFNVKV